VCYDCITDPEHRIATVVQFGKYLLNPGDCESVCPLTKKRITEQDEVIRFMNMQLFLLEAIKEYGFQKSPLVNSLDQLTIPGADEPMLPSPDDKSKLAQEIRMKLSQFDWFKDKLSSSVNDVYVSSRPTNTITSNTTTSTFVAPRKPAPSSEFVIDMEDIHTDDPQGKNRHKPLRKVYETISLMYGPLSPVKLLLTLLRTSYFKLNTNRNLFILGIIITIGILFFMGFSLSDEGTIEPQNTDINIQTE